MRKQDHIKIFGRKGVERAVAGGERQVVLDRVCGLRTRR